MAKPNFIKERARQEGISEIELIQRLIDVHNHKTAEIAADLDITPEAVWMYLKNHGYRHECRWVLAQEPSQAEASR